MSYEPDKELSRVLDRVKSAVSELEKDEILTRIEVDRDAGVVRIYTEKSNELKKAHAGLGEVLELAYTTAEHHPYWGMLYHSTEIARLLLDKWESQLSPENISDLKWRIDEIMMALDRARESYHTD